MQEKIDPPDASVAPSRLPGPPLSESSIRLSEASVALSESCPRLSGWQIWSGHGIRLSFWCVFAATLLFVGAVAVARFWLIPNADSFRPRVVSELSRLTGQRVAIGGFEAGWNGWSPELKLTKL